MSEFKMDFNTVYNGRTYEVGGEYLFKIIDSERVGKYRLKGSLISDLEKIRDKYDYNDVNRVCETTRLLVTEYAPEFCQSLED